MYKSLTLVTKIFILTTILILSFSVNSQNKKNKTPYIGFGTDTKMVKVGVIGSELYYSLSEMIISDSTVY